MMTLFTLAQTTQPAGESDWKFWVMCVIGVLTLLQSMFSPVIGWALKMIWNRLKTGDEKFEAQAVTIQEIKTKIEAIEEDSAETKKKQEQADRDRQEMSLAAATDLGDLKVAIEREFVRKSEFSKLAELLERRHEDVMTAVHQLERSV